MKGRDVIFITTYIHPKHSINRIGWPIIVNCFRTLRDAGNALTAAEQLSSVESNTISRLVTALHPGRDFLFNQSRKIVWVSLWIFGRCYILCFMAYHNFGIPCTIYVSSISKYGFSVTVGFYVKKFTVFFLQILGWKCNIIFLKM